MVEGGGITHTQFLTEGLADELHLVVAPFFVGDSRARRSSATDRSHGMRSGGRAWPRFVRSATSCSCGTRCRLGLVRRDR
jgi:riboflavin biosynthesis pyrimidine reductase